MSNYRRAQFSILKWVNYKDGSVANLAKKLDYIAHPASSPEQFRRGYFVNPLSPIEGLKTIHQRYRPVGSRTFKHVIFSFGVSDISLEVAFAVSQQLVEYYAKKYPMLLCLHTNIPNRIHAHMIMSTCNIIDGKKFSQSPAEFEVYRRYFNSVMKKHNLPLLKNANNEAGMPVNEQPVSDNNDDFYNEQVNHLYSAVPGYWNTAKSSESFIIVQPQRVIEQSNIRVNCKISCDMNSIRNSIQAGMTELEMFAKKSGGIKNE